MSEIKLVKQEEDFGCVVACIAMVTGKTYEEVRCDFRHDFSKKGMKSKKYLEYLANEGYAAISKRIKYWSNREQFRASILEPFAPVHLVTIQQFFDTKQTHLVVMDANGKLICPGGVSDEQIRQSYTVTEIIGLYK